MKHGPFKFLTSTTVPVLHIMFSLIRVSVLVAALALVTKSNAQSQAQCARNYTVHLGDFCDGISAAQHTSTFQLANANQGVINTDCSNLAVGMARAPSPLCLGDLGKDCSTVTVVESGVGCATIVDNAGIALDTLLHNNPNVNADCTNIYPGEVLCTSGGLFNY
ncbi:hypothetical protein D9758_011383 [Tetrapyrgos nigripes]|uniref:LysM domain-containing protein n=1 Tax=Tetrapyrgos nigripes TaxID=182062 RepID=A0A8H5G8F6_9AGAR|nr:hypothetical protein D9758_011383 [Tetrapyrgos nigripes]